MPGLSPVWIAAGFAVRAGRRTVAFGSVEGLDIGHLGSLGDAGRHVQEGAADPAENTEVQINFRKAGGWAIAVMSVIRVLHCYGKESADRLAESPMIEPENSCRMLTPLGEPLGRTAG